MKIRVSLSVEVDPEAWEDIYGTSRSDLRDDVRKYAQRLLADSAAAEEGAIRRVWTTS